MRGMIFFKTRDGFCSFRIPLKHNVDASRGLIIFNYAQPDFTACSASFSSACGTKGIPGLPVQSGVRW